MSAPADAPYTMRSLQQMLGLSRGVITRLIAARYVTPVRGRRNEYRFGFQDVVALRTAHELRHARVPHRRLLRSLRELRQRLPAELPSSGLRIKAVGEEVAVLSGGAAWNPQSGQLLIDFEVTPAPASAPLLHFRAAPVPVPVPAPVSMPDPATAAEWHRRGQALESSDPEGAEAAYREALRLAPDHAASYVDLGALLCTAGRCAEAIDLHDAALRLAPDDPHVHFNAAIALEDQDHLAAALGHYEQALRLDPLLADAHFNAARLCEQLGDPQGALRHFSAYRRLARLRGPAPEDA